jgi:hypothetical protein
MTIKVAYTKFGTIMGDFTELLHDRWAVEKPVFVNATLNNVSFFPFLGITQATEITLTPDDLNFGEVFEPAIELRNYYSEQFGSGIVLQR